MKELGYDLAEHRSKSLDRRPPQPFDAAITMGCGDACPNITARLRVDWQIPDPKDLPERRKCGGIRRSTIEGKVKELLATIEPRP